MSILYKYNPHNIAFIAEAAQHAGRWKDMAGAIAMLSYGAGFALVADPSMASLVSYHTRQVLQPLRFGLYQALVDGTNPGGNCPLQVGHSVKGCSAWLSESTLLPCSTLLPERGPEG